MAELFLAERSGAHGARRRVVLKRILPAFARDPDFRELFVHEARIAMQLTHANIVQVYDFDESGDSYVLEMEYVEGCDLRALLRKYGPLPLGAALRVSVEILRGLDYAHRRTGADGVPLQIVHRDVSPGNILLSKEGEVKLTDFGLARSRERWGRSTGGVKGTFAFMAPEQAEGQPVDSRADVFATGAILYAALSGRSPFEEEGPVATLDRVRQARFDPVSQSVPDVPEELDALLSMSLARDPAYRFASAAAMCEALETVAHTHGLRLGADALGPLVCKAVPEVIIEAQEVMTRRSGSDISVDEAAPTVETPIIVNSVTGSLPLDPEGPRAQTVASPRRLARTRSWKKLAWIPAIAVLGIVGAIYWATRPSSPRIETTQELPPPRRVDAAGTTAPQGGNHAANLPNGTVANGGAIPVSTGPTSPASGPETHLMKAPKPKTAYLTVSADPWAFVFIDGTKRGTTPLNDLQLTAGPHELLLENPDLKSRSSKVVRLHPGEHKKIIENLSRENR
jgi:serine/threonine protein kinase